MSTYTPIASITLGSAQTPVTCNNIPQTYTDLVVVMVAATTHSSATFPYLRFNSDSGTNYSVTELYGTGSAAGSARDTSTSRGWIGFDVSISTTVGNNVSTINVMNYSNTTTNKTWLARSNRADSALDYQGTNAIVGLYRSTSAITSVELKNSRGGTDYNFASGSTFNLYGIANASITNTAKATGGDSVTTDGTYWYHTFRSSGTFTPTQALTADYLVVAGGGGGGNHAAGGGGGAGGLRSTVTATGGGGTLESALTLQFNTAYIVTVGAGGVGGASGGTDGDIGTAGGNSSISGSGITTVTSTGGGRGGGTTSTVSIGGNGGSGGGGSYIGSAGGGTGTANQGYAGGNGVATGVVGGGGGGAGAVGANAVASTSAGNGGNGVAVSITGSSVTYAGGGGGGNHGVTSGGNSSGGSGGGGAGGQYATQPSADGIAGTANLGGGGGGAGGRNGFNPGAGGNGGSGIVIIRYAV